MTVVLLSLNTLATAQEAPETIPKTLFTSPEANDNAPLVNADGFVDLIWTVENTAADSAPVFVFELQSAATADFIAPVIHYRGSDMRSFVSGLTGRDYFFRVRAADAEGRAGPWSDTLAIEVQYVSPTQVGTLMLLGFFCLLATLGIIVAGSYRTPYHSATSH